MGRPVGRFAALLMRAPGLPLHLATAIGVAGAFAAFSAPAPYFILLIWAYMFWMALGAVWVLRLIAFVITAMIHRQPLLRSNAAKWRRWAIAPVLALTTGGLLYIDAPLRLTLVLSLPALNRAAAEAPSVGQAPAADRWIGLFPARSSKRVAGGFEFEVRDAGFFDTCGIGRYDQPPVDSGWTHYRWILGDWYAWRRDW